MMMIFWMWFRVPSELPVLKETMSENLTIFSLAYVTLAIAYNFTISPEHMEYTSKLDDGDNSQKLQL